MFNYEVLVVTLVIIIELLTKESKKNLTVDLQKELSSSCISTRSLLLSLTSY